MAKFCSNCGNKLDDFADVCLKCGVLVNKSVSNKKSVSNVNGNKKRFPIWAIVLIIIGCVILVPLIIFILFGLFVFRSFNFYDDDCINEMECIDEEADNYYYDDYDVISEGTIGDTLELDGIKFTLEKELRYSSVGENNIVDIPSTGNEYVVFFFEVENTSYMENFVTYLNFSGLVDDEKCMPKLLFNDIDDYGNLNKNLEAGDITNGYVVFEVEKGWENFELNYRRFVGDKTIRFYIANESNNANLEV